MEYVANGYFLGKHSYTFTDDKTNEVKNITTTDVLVYDAQSQFGLEKPRVVSLTVPTDEDDGLIRSHLESVKVCFDLSYDKKTGNMRPKATAVIDF